MRSFQEPKSARLEQSVRRLGRPELDRSRGTVMFLLDNDPGPIRDAYIAGRPSLQGRVIFTSVPPGNDDAAFVKRNDPLGANTAQIQELVRDGYYVRSRTDVPLGTVRSGDTEMLEAARASGAQIISTDFPQVGGVTRRCRASGTRRRPCDSRATRTKA